MAVGLERAHPQFLGQGEGLAVGGCGWLTLRGIAMRRNVAEEAQGIRLVAPLPALMGECQRTFGQGMRLVQTASQQMRLPKGEVTERLKEDHVHGRALFHRLREQWHGVAEAPAQSIRHPQGHSYPWEIGWEVRLVTEAHGPFKLEECSG